ncbi:MAG: PAS domain S-box protein [Proteobacteria bacterium]|nr:PAS domain S-box protein [Pseudomonadota bacterium]
MDEASSKNRTVLSAVLVGISFYLGARLGLTLSMPPDYIATLWPANAVVIAVLLLIDRRRWWIYFLAMTPGYFAAALQADFSVLRATIFYTANCIEIFIAALTLKRTFDKHRQFDRLREMVLFLFWAVLIAPLVSASIAACASFSEPAVNYWRTWHVWFLGDALGILTLTPVITLWILSGLGWAKEISFTRLIEGSGLALCLLAATFLTVGTEAWASNNFPALLYTPLPLFLWAAIRFGPRGISSTVFVVTLLTIWNALHGRGPFTANSPADNVLSLQLFLVAISFPMMLLASLLAERKRVEEALRNSEKKYKTLFASSADAISILDAETGRFIDCNSAAVKLHGTGTREKFLGLTPDQLSPRYQPSGEASYDLAMQHIQKAFSEGADVFEWTHCKSDGTPFPALVSLGSMQFGEQQLVMAIGRDLTDLKNAEALIKKEHENFLLIFAAAPVGLLLLDENTVITEANKTVAHLVLREPGEVIGKRSGGGLGCIHSQEDPRGCGFGSACPVCPLRNGIESVLKSGQSIYGAEINPTLLIEGTPRELWLSVNAEPLEIDGRQYVVVAIDDITERKQITEALRKSEERFRLVADYAYDWETWLSPEGKLLYTSPSCKDISGYDREDFYHDDTLFEKIVHPADLELFCHHHEMFLSHENKACEFEFRIMNKSGEVKYLSHICQSVYGDDKQYLGRRGSNRDITERKLLENQLYRFKNTLDQAHDCVFMFSPDTLHFLYVNQGAIDHVGYTAEELYLMTPLDIKPRFTEKCFREMLASLTEKRHSSLRFETVHQHKNGTKIPVDVFLQYVAANDEEGLFVAIIRDISEQKKLEGELRDYALQQKTLLQEVNHRVKNNLTAIISMLHLEEDRAEKQVGVEQTSQLKEVICRVEGLLIVHTLLSASKWKPLRLSQLCHEVISRTMSSLSVSQTMRLDVAPSDVQVDADQAHHLALVLNELATNTVKYGCQAEAAGSISVSLEKKDDEVHLTYRDDGIGFSESVLQGKSPRMGIGINMIRGIIRKSMQGEVRLSNQEGAVIVITFPEHKANI